MTEKDTPPDKVFIAFFGPLPFVKQRRRIMKKTEKIEVRLSHEEKASLSQLAENEGRSVSELVRGLIDRYISLHTDKLPLKTRWGLLSAMGIGGILLGHLGTYFMVQSHSRLEIYQLGVEIQNSSLSVPITRTEGEISEFILPNALGDIYIKTLVQQGSGELSTVQVTLCQMLGEACEEIASPILSFNSQKISRLQFGDDKKSLVNLSLSPP